MKLIGREKEQALLSTCLSSKQPEFVVVYGRRRVGKTFLIKEYFKNEFAFYTTGITEGRTFDQLKYFALDLADFGVNLDSPLKSWADAFASLKTLLIEKSRAPEWQNRKLVVFIDEMPWFDTPRSGFKAALEHFWNSWASSNENILLIACGSATSWLAKNLLDSKGGFYNRVTRIIDLQPFTLQESLDFFKEKGIRFNAKQTIECLMVFGGIPFYLNLLNKGESVSQNIQRLCFDSGGQLANEFSHLYNSLFNSSKGHVEIVKRLARKKSGLTRSELRTIKGMTGSQLTRILWDLEQCGFVRSYSDFVKKNNSKTYQLIDPFTLFHFRFLESSKYDSWLTYRGTPAYYSWRGNSFEAFCFLHIEEIKTSLGINGISTKIASWRSEKVHPGVQIDMLINRADDIITVCEMKFSDDAFIIDAACSKELQQKIEALRIETKTRKAVHLALVTVEEVAQNEYSDTLLQNTVSFAEIIEKS